VVEVDDRVGVEGATAAVLGRVSADRAIRHSQIAVDDRDCATIAVSSRVAGEGTAVERNRFVKP
jgi:hypothetical protein